jgi:hypothetical protein
VDGRSSIAAAQVVGHPQAAQVTALGLNRMGLEAHVAPCTPHGLSPAELPVPAEGPVLAPRAPALVPALALVRRVREPGAQVV